MEINIEQKSLDQDVDAKVQALLSDLIRYYGPLDRHQLTLAGIINVIAGLPPDNPFRPKLRAILTQRIDDILAKADITLDQLAYVGDDIVDLGVMRQCGLAIATANAREQVKSACHWTTPLPGGQGAGRDAIDFILAAQGKLDAAIAAFLDAENPAASAADISTGEMS